MLVFVKLCVPPDRICNRRHHLIDMARLDDIGRTQHQIFTRDAQQHAALKTIQKNIVGAFAG